MTHDFRQVASRAPNAPSRLPHAAQCDLGLPPEAQRPAQPSSKQSQASPGIRHPLGSLRSEIGSSRPQPPHSCALLLLPSCASPSTSLMARSAATSRATRACVLLAGCLAVMLAGSPLARADAGERNHGRLLKVSWVPKTQIRGGACVGTRQGGEVRW